MITKRIAKYNANSPDCLGNNRAVINGTTSELEQTVAYYPYGGVIADLGSGHGFQPYKYGGKELMTANGLNEYDFGARQYRHAVPGFSRIDPLCEKYYWLSPYLYCGNDPVNAIDPDGRIIIFVNGYIGGGSPPAGEPYWNGRNSSFVRGAIDYFNDNKVMFLLPKYSSASIAAERMQAGYHFAENISTDVLSRLDSDESIKFITHSMGAAFGEGMAGYFAHQGIEISDILHINPYQAEDIRTLEREDMETNTIDFQDEWDPVINLLPGSGDIKGADHIVRRGWNKGVADYFMQILNIHRSPISEGSDFWKFIKQSLKTEK